MKWTKVYTSQVIRVKFKAPGSSSPKLENDIIKEFISTYCFQGCKVSQQFFSTHCQMNPYRPHMSRHKKMLLLLLQVFA